MPTVVIRRRVPDFGFTRGINVDVDGRRVASLRPGSRVSVDLAEGSHELVASIDWIKGSPLPLDVHDSDLKVAIFLPWRVVTEMQRSGNPKAPQTVIMARVE